MGKHFESWLKFVILKNVGSHFTVLGKRKPSDSENWCDENNDWLDICRCPGKYSEQQFYQILLDVYLIVAKNILST